MTDQTGAAAGTDNDLIDLCTEIVSAYVSHNALSVTDLPRLISDVHVALRGLKTNGAPEPVEELKPAVPVRKSVAADYIICLEDGKKFKSLKRHLRTHYDLSPEELKDVPNLPGTLDDALKALEADHEFLLKGDVFSTEMIERWVKYKREHEIQPLRLRPHPLEFSMYYDI